MQGIESSDIFWGLFWLVIIGVPTYLLWNNGPADWAARKDDDWGGCG